MEQIIISLLVYIALELTRIRIKIHKENEEKVETKMDNIPSKSFKEMEDDLKIIDKQLEISIKKLDSLSKKLDSSSKNIDFLTKKEISRLWKWEE